MSSRLLLRTLAPQRTLAPTYARAFATSAPPRRPMTSARKLALLSGAALGAGTIALAFRTPVRADAALATNADARQTHAAPALSDLVRSYVVYTLCSIPFLIDHAPALLDTLLGVPVVGSVTEAVVRATFFAQFVGADTAQDCIPLLRKLREEHKGALLVYSAEAEADGSAIQGEAAGLDALPPHKRAVEEVLRSIDAAADFEDSLGGVGVRQSWVAVKLSALLPDARALRGLSAHLLATRPELPTPVPFPGAPRPTDLALLSSPTPPASSQLRPDDLAALAELHADLIRIGERARARGVKLAMDAEYAWAQPAIDAFVLALMRRFNAAPPGGGPRDVQPLVHQTVQAYLRRTPAYLAHALAEAEREQFALGVKLVRGAYHGHETATHADGSSLSREKKPPVWEAKAETDTAFDDAARALVHAAAAGAREGKPGVGVIFGTHNAASCQLVLEELERAGLARRGSDGVLRVSDAGVGRVAIAQLYGMADALTDSLVATTTTAGAPLVLKYLPYGALKEVMPYLGRRAIENKSLLGAGAAADERRRAGREIRARLRGWIGL